MNMIMLIISITLLIAAALSWRASQFMLREARHHYLCSFALVKCSLFLQEYAKRIALEQPIEDLPTTEEIENLLQLASHSITEAESVNAVLDEELAKFNLNIKS